jgi:hypothetical protein
MSRVPGLQPTVFKAAYVIVPAVWMVAKGVSVLIGVAWSRQLMPVSTALLKTKGNQGLSAKRFT